MPDVNGLLNDVWDSTNHALRTSGPGAGGAESVTIVENTSSTATLANQNDQATNVTLQALNAGRKGWSVFNDSTSNLFVKFGATASATSFTVKLGAGQYYEMPKPVYTGIIDGIWDVDGSGAARMTELT